MTKHYLLNGDEIKVGGIYKTRDGRKAFVSCIVKDDDGFENIYGSIEGSSIGRKWHTSGNIMVSFLKDFDLISLWKDEPVTNCNQLIEVTDELIELACSAHYKAAEKWFDIYAYTNKDCMKAALKAVFNHIANNKEKPNSSIFDSFPPENPILDEEKQDNIKINTPMRFSDWCKDYLPQLLPTEKEKEPKKQTLLEFAAIREDDINLLTPKGLVLLFSKYLEQNK